MEITTVSEDIKSLNYLIVAYDVSQKKHNYYTSFSNGSKLNESEGIISSSTKKIKEHFKVVKDLSERYGFNGVCIACEPTGGYEHVLLRQARAHGFFTKYVNGEATNKAKVIESNDANKTDTKDARVIHMLASQGKTLSCEERSEEYAKLKFYNAKYEDLSLEAASKKTVIFSLKEALFPDLSLKPRQLYSKIVSCVIDEFSLNPYKIGVMHFGDFLEVVEKAYGRQVGGSPLGIVMSIWEEAQVALLNIMPKWQSNSLADELKRNYERRADLEEKKEEYRKLMVELVEETEEWEKVKDSKVGEFMFSRVLAETGNWKNFKTWRQVLRFGGLNLRERQSGKFNGKLKLSKKGNILMRKVLGQLCYSTYIGKGKLYSEFFQQQKAKKGGVYAIACVMRKTLKMLFGIYKSQANFNIDRVFDQNVNLSVKAA